jgi:hypothetical protein
MSCSTKLRGTGHPLLATAACVPDAAQKIVFDPYQATRYVKKEAAGSPGLDLVRVNRMPGQGRSA